MSLFIPRQFFILVFGDTITHRIGRVCSLTSVLQGEVSALTVGEAIIFLQTDVIRHAVVVGTVVGNVQFAVAVDQRQVTVAIKTAYMLRTDGDEVAVIDIHDIGADITHHRLRVGIDHIVTHRHVTTGKHGVTDDDTIEVELFPEFAVCRGLFLQMVKVASRNKVPRLIAAAIRNFQCTLGLTIRSDEHTTVVGQVVIAVIIIIGIFTA